MSVRDEELEEFENRYRQVNLPEALQRAVDWLTHHSEEKVVQLNPPSDDFYLTRGEDFNKDMGIGYKQFLVGREIYVIFRKYTEHHL
jgi:hypothetical protein